MTGPGLRALPNQVELRLAPWTSQLGADHVAYAHHVMRVLLLCDRLEARIREVSDSPPSHRPEYLAAAAFHDLGIWTEGTFDYLAPSVKLARQWLASHAQEHLEPLVTRMIEQHHKIRQADASSSPVEVFRRADTIDVTYGLRRFGLPLREYRAIVRRYPDAGFHRRLVAIAWRQARTNPTSPFPMLKW